MCYKRRKIKNTSIGYFDPNGNKAFRNGNKTRWNEKGRSEDLPARNCKYNFKNNKLNEKNDIYIIVLFSKWSL
ncbi:hypothetical protein BAX99_20325 [Elizabethkingia miricola]|nr:hypothetical protein BAX99_20325 [Elizabethkingia miricola]